MFFEQKRTLFNGAYDGASGPENAVDLTTFRRDGRQLKHRDRRIVNACRSSEVLEDDLKDDL